LFGKQDQPTRDTAYFLIYKKFFSRLIDAIDEARHKQTLTFDSLILNTAEVDTLPRPNFLRSRPGRMRYWKITKIKS
jgi:hypothetical protein